MTENELNFLTVSQCVSSDYCKGYNEAVAKANEIINEQQAEIDKRNKVIAELKEVVMLWEAKYKVVRIKVAKEFAEKIKIYKFQSIDWVHGEHPYVVKETDIDNGLDKMVGEKE